MNTNILGTGEMVSLTALWVGKQKHLFTSIKKIEPFYEDVEAAHQLVVTVNQAGVASERVAQLTQELRETDLRHDDAIRAVSDTLTGAIRYLELKGRTEEARRVQSLLELLLPEGLSYVLRAYREEAGNAEAMLEKLDTPTREALRNIPLYDGTVLDAVLLWGELGKRLGELESQRAILVASQPEEVSEKAARLQWIGTVKQVLSSLKLVRGQEEAVIAIRQPVIDAVAAAVARAGRRDKASTAKTSGETGNGATDAGATGDEATNAVTMDAADGP